MKKTLKWQLAQKLERLWWKRYLLKQSPEEYTKWKTAYWNKLYGNFATEIDLKPSDHVADLGCGPAGIYTIFSNNPVVAVDPLIESYEKDLRVFNKSDYINTHFINATIEEFEYKHSFNLVCCLNAINHVSNIDLAFKQLSKHCNKGGYCLLSIDAHNFKILKHLFRAIPGDALHPHQYDLHEYEEMFRNAGFNLIETQLYKTHPIFNYYILLGKKL